MTEVSKRTRTSFDGLLAEIEDARRLAAQPERCAIRNDSVSHWVVRQQLDHLLLTDAAILQGLHAALAGNVPDQPGGRPSLMGYLILWAGVIPRGRAEAPQLVLPTDRSPEDIESGFRDAHRDYSALADSLVDIDSSRATQAHPILGHFNGSRWLRFAHIHHRHHQKIIHDILRPGTKR